MSKFIFDFLSKFDAFGAKVNLKYRQDDLYRTPFGGLMTISLLSVLILAFQSTIYYILILNCNYNQITTLLDKTKVTAITSLTFDTNPSTLEIGNGKFMIAVKYDQLNFISRPMMNITFEKRHYQRFQNGTLVKYKVIRLEFYNFDIVELIQEDYLQLQFNNILLICFVYSLDSIQKLMNNQLQLIGLKYITPLDLEPCTLEHFENITYNDFNFTKAYQELNVSDYLCLKKNETFQIGGSFDNEHFYHIKYVLSKCNNGTNKNKPWQPICEDQKKINILDANSRVTFLVTNTILNPEQAIDPVKSFFYSVIFSTSPERMITNSNIMLTQQRMKTDESITPYKQNSIQDYTLIQNGDYKDSYSIGNYSNYCEIFFLRSPFSTVHSRSYLKLDQVISYIGGFCQIFILIVALLGKLFSTIYTNLILGSNLIITFLNKWRQLNQSIFENLKFLNLIKINVFFQKVSFYNDYVFTIELANKLYDFNFDKNYMIDKRKGSIMKGKQNIESQRNLLTQERIKSKNNEEINLFQTTQNNNDINYFEKNLNNQNKLLTLEENLQNNQKIIIATNKLKRLDSYITNQSFTEKISECPDIQDSQRQREEQFDFFTNSSPISMRKFQKKYNKTQFLKYQSNDISLSNVNLENQICNEGKTGKNEIDFLSLNFKKKNKNIPKIELFKSNSYAHSNNSSFNQQQINNVGDSPSKFSHLPHVMKESTISLVKKQFLQNQGLLDTKSFLENELKPILSRDRKIKLRFEFFINKITCGKFFNNTRVQLLKKATDHVKSDLDLFTILDKVKELEKFKKVFLSEDQQSVFNFFPKPLISIHNEQNVLSKTSFKSELSQKEEIKQKDLIRKYLKIIKVQTRYIPVVYKAVQQFKLSIEEDQFSNYQKLYGCYEQLIKPTNSEMEQQINKKLIELLGSEMKHIFGLTRQQNQQLIIYMNQLILNIKRMKLKQIRKLRQAPQKASIFINYERSQKDTQEENEKEELNERERKECENQQNNMEKSISVASEFKQLEQNPLSELPAYVINKDHANLNIQMTESLHN